MNDIGSYILKKDDNLNKRSRDFWFNVIDMDCLW